MKKRIALQALLLLLAVPAGLAQGFPETRTQAARPGPAELPQSIIEDGLLKSASLGREMHYRVHLPAGCRASSHRHPTLYLLHGLTGSYIDWEGRTHLAEIAQRFDLIIVMPDADDSWYVNSATGPQEKYEDYLTKDLLPEIDKNFRTIAARYARALAGLSMGGYGAMKLALKYPQLFAVAASCRAGIPGTTGTGSSEPFWRCWRGEWTSAGIPSSQLGERPAYSMCRKPLSNVQLPARHPAPQFDASPE